MVPKRVYVIGVGMTKFEKPGQSNVCYTKMAQEAVNKALEDAKINYKSIQQAAVGYVFGDSTCGQRILYELGMTGIPIYNVNNNCATGATAMFLVKQIIATGNVECALALGFEKMQRGSLSSMYFDRANPMERHVAEMSDLADIGTGPITAQIFGNAGKEHMRKYGSKPEHFAKIAMKNHKHSVNNPNSQFRDDYSLEQIMESPQVLEGVLTRLQCCPTSDGAAAAILASESFVRRNGLEAQAVEIVGMEMATDPADTFSKRSLMSIAGYDMTRLATVRLFAKSIYKVQDVDVVELHDCFSANELITYEALGLCPEGKAAEFIDRGDNTYGGRVVVNPSGGLISKGHPLGATGLAQCAELCWQLRGLAGKRQVPKCSLALQHNLGLGGAVVITLYRLGFPKGGRQVVHNLTAKIATTPKGFKAQKTLEILEMAMKEDEDKLVEKVRGIFGIRVTNGPNGATAYWVINTKEGKGTVTFNGTDKTDITVILDDDDLPGLISGEISPTKAYMQGKLKVQGNLGLGLKVMDLRNLQAERFKALKAKM